MESSRRAVEAYKRTRLIDFVIIDDDNVSPIYRLDEICEMLRTSSSDMVREVVEYTMKRLESRSPRVKQKMLRMIKYAVVKGGPEFKRQMQRQAAGIRQLFEYKGQPDVLKGDALNKAVRDTAHEAIAAIFSSDDKPPQADEVNKRIMGFGSTNYDMHAVTDVKKPSLTNVVNDVLEFGTASIKQGLTMISGYSGANIGNIRNDTGSYRGPGLMRSLTSERGSINRFEHEERPDSRPSVESLGVTLGQNGNNSRVNPQESTSARADINSSPEERLLDTITAPGGMRLQPTRENMQKFMASVGKFDSKNLFYALESKLRSPAWQTRFKTLCVIEVIIRQRDEEFFGAIVDYLEEDATLISDCLQLPQTTLRDKATKVLHQLRPFSKDSHEMSSEHVAVSKDVLQPSVVYDMPNLIDTGDSDLLASKDAFPQVLEAGDGSSCVTKPVGDLFGEDFFAQDGEASIEAGPDDLFTGVSIYAPDREPDDPSAGLFAGLSLNKPAEDAVGNGSHESKEASANSKLPSLPDSLMDLLGSATLNDPLKEDSLSGLAQNGGSFVPPTSVQIPHYGSGTPYQLFGRVPSSQATQLNAMLNSQMAHFNTTDFRPMGMFTNYQAPNFGGVHSIQQKQFSGGMVGIQGSNMGVTGMNGGTFQGFGGSSRISVDSFDFSGDASLRFTSAAESEKRENTKAFDFISDHVSAARTLKKP